MNMNRKQQYQRKPNFITEKIHILPNKPTKNEYMMYAIILSPSSFY